MTDAKSLAIVTGASSGIGKVYADRLASRGHDLMIIARRRDRLGSLAEQLRSVHGCKVEIVTADLSQAEDLTRIATLVAEAPRLVILVNCAGSGALGFASTVDPESVDAMVKVNVVALTRLSLAAAQRFSDTRHGTIVNIGSIIGVTATPGAGGYSGSKAYVLTFSRALQAELSSSGVVVQVVMPGPVRSEFFGEMAAPFPDELFMSAETLVDTALAALDDGEAVTFPNLEELAAWTRYDTARGNLVAALTKSGRPASRYERLLVAPDPE